MSHKFVLNNCKNWFTQARYSWEGVRRSRKMTAREYMRGLMLSAYFSVLRAYYWVRGLFSGEAEVEEFVF